MESRKRLEVGKGNTAHCSFHARQRDEAGNLQPLLGEPDVAGNQQETQVLCDVLVG